MQYLEEKWAEHAEKPSKWFINLAGNKSARATLNKVQVPELDINTGEVVKDDAGKVKMKLVTSKEEVLEGVGKHYTEMFKQGTTTASLAEFMSSRGEKIIPDYKRLTPEMREGLEKDLLITELDESCKNLKPNSAPGVDGFCASWVQALWPYLSKPLYRAAMQAEIE